MPQELNDSKTKLLKFVEEQGQWEKERSFLIAKIDVVNENQMILEKEREEKEKKKQVETDQPSVEKSTECIVQAMFQVSLKDEEIKGLKSKNHKLAKVVKKKEEERNFFENKSKDLLEKNEKLTKRKKNQDNFQCKGPNI